MLSADSANSTTSGYHVGVDIGGTFTDLVTVAENGETYRAKALTTPADYTRGIMEGLERLVEVAGTSVTEMMNHTGFLINGSTIVTNAVAELKGRRVGVITTRGFKDTGGRASQAFRACERSATSDDLRLMVQAKDRFYGVLFEGAGNQTIKGILDELRARIAALRTTTLGAPGRPQQSVEEIRAIVEAIEAGDGEAAAEAASNHVRQAARVLFNTYARSIPAAEGLVS